MQIAPTTAPVVSFMPHPVEQAKSLTFASLMIARSATVDPAIGSALLDGANQAREAASLLRSLPPQPAGYSLAIADLDRAAFSLSAAHLAMHPGDDSFTTRPRPHAAREHAIDAVAALSKAYLHLGATSVPAGGAVASQA